MSCRRFETMIALYVEGDLPDRKTRRVAEHLDGCAACRELSEGLAASQQALKALRGASVDEGVYRELRRRVLARIDATRAGAWPRWAYAAAAGLIVLLGTWAIWRRPSPPPPLRETGRVSLPERSQPAALSSAPASHAAVRKPQARRTAPAQVSEPRATASAVQPELQPAEVEPTASPAPLLVKLFTDDPDVVIYWIVNGNEEGE
jgi:anti-sigma factor RsiW